KLKPNKDNVDNLKAEAKRKADELVEIERMRGGTKSWDYADKQKEIEETNRKMADEEAKMKAAKEAAMQTDEYRELHAKAEAANSRIEDRNFNDNEYSAEFRNGLKKQYEDAAYGGRRRQEAYAERIERGPSGAVVAAGAALGPLGLSAGLLGKKKIGKYIGSMQGNKAAARAIRKEAKGKAQQKDWLTRQESVKRK
ncbi:MAG: hypothetical protein AAB863_02015, partial [Patescibacteria group bacterium]